MIETYQHNSNASMSYEESPNAFTDMVYILKANRYTRAVLTSVTFRLMKKLKTTLVT